MTAPRATMRLQFHQGFTFADAQALVPYFFQLGISHIYASPILTSRRGSMHGYDVVDPTCINPELGGENAFRLLVEELRHHGLGLILDIVPNHMATGSANAWWMDVLARGKESAYAKYFDIDWHPPAQKLRDKVLLPVLGRPYGEVLEAGEITVGLTDDQSSVVIRYFDNSFPIAQDRNFDQRTIAELNSQSSRGRALLHALLERQHYRLAFWRTANDEINWRRFFDINELVALRVEDDEVFEATHATIFSLFAQGLIDGVRIDHIDGLSEPGNYCRKLRRRFNALESERPDNAPAGSAYIVVEKILAHDERLSKDWQIDGTTGYDFMDEISAFQHKEEGEPYLRDFWHHISGRQGDFQFEELLARREILERSFSAQRAALVASLSTIAQADLKTRDNPPEAIRRGLTEILAHFPIYRTYARVGQVSASDDVFLAEAVAKAGKSCLPSDRSIVAALGKTLSGKRLQLELDALQNTALTRFQQLSSPLCAKAIEDTAFYRYGRLISRNDVGFNARQFACSAGEFHRTMKQRFEDFPDAMLATATHDHKRGEDVRARLAVISEIPKAWTEAVGRWIELCDHQYSGGGKPLNPGDLAILFQTVVGAWPLDLALDDPDALSAYAKRISAWQQKALREAKLRSDWSAPDDSYESAMSAFIAWLFNGSSELLREVDAFARRIAPAGAANGLAQTLIKLTAPGVPDFYQGTEYWDLSLVDPDNRAPVDFAVRQKSLSSDADAQASPLWQNGFVKQRMIARVLAVRNETPDLFAKGTYLPLEASGPMAKHVTAFARYWRETVAVVVICRFTGQLETDEFQSLPTVHCTNTRVRIPAELNGNYHDVVSTAPPQFFDSEVSCAEIFNELPVACFIRQ